MGLLKYFSKRKFDRTPEPKGKVKKSASKKLEFVIQKHHASQLHYDFRLELDGVLKSWAVPKGPSLNPQDHHLAVEVEDHPYEYRKFEGVIPDGNYGAGEVIIWDKGTYEPRVESDEDPQVILRRELGKGHITFILHGEKLQGEFALIKMHGKDKKAWLLIKKGDEFASKKDITRQDASVVSGKTVEDLDFAPQDLSAYPRSAMPHSLTPMLATLVDEPFNREGWLYEIKWDGYRAIADRNKKEVELYSRNQLDFRERYPEITHALGELPFNAVLDGEIVVVDEDGRPHFEKLQGWGKGGDGELRYYAFDILWYEGRDIKGMPLKERKELLRRILPKKPPLFYSDYVETDGEGLFTVARERGLEGTIAKKADSSYSDGVRSGNWLKIKTHQRQEVVIGGFTEGRGTRTWLGALVLGVYEKGEFVYVAHTNAGMPEKERKLLRERLEKIERKSSPFKIEPKPNAVVHWVRPKIVCEVEFSEWTKDGSMRQPEFKGLRPDKDAKDVKREKPKKPSLSERIQGAGDARSKRPKPQDVSGALELTHLDKIFFPERGYTKGDLIKYYETVADTMLPYLMDRPHSLNRQPGGYKDRGFFQKNVTFHLPKFGHTATVHSKSTNEDVHYLVCKNIETLLYMAQLGCIEINPWSSRVGKMSHPDWAVMDLDPEGVTFKDVIEVAKTVHEVCEEWNIPSYPKTSGKTGIHVFIPLGPKYTYEQAKNFVHLIALEVHARQPKITSVERLPKNRKHKIYLDFLQNSKGQTLAAPYSVRPTKEASVSAPLHWDEVVPSLSPMDFTIKNMPARIAKLGDLWEPVVGKPIDMAGILRKIT